MLVGHDGGLRAAYRLCHKSWTLAHTNLLILISFQKKVLIVPKDTMETCHSWNKNYCKKKVVLMFNRL